MLSPSQTTPYIRNAIDLNRFGNKLSDDVVKVYVNAARELLRDFSEQSGSTETRMARLNAQALQIRDTISSAYADKYPDLIKELTAIANRQAKFQSKTIQKQIPKGIGVNVRTVEVSRDYVEALAKGDPKAKLELSGDEIIRRSLPRILPDDQPALNKVFGDLADSSSKTLENSLRSGLLLGKTNDEIVRGLLDGNKIPKGSPLKKTERAVRTVVQSAVIGVGAEAQLLTIEANKDITDEYEFLATLDGRTSPQCRALDGKIFKVSDATAPRPPIHYRCRSTLIASLARFFKDNDIELEEGTRASMDGQVPADLNYEQWLKTQTPAFQDSVLGKGKGRLFRSGMGLAQMVREDGAAKKLDELEE